MAVLVMLSIFIQGPVHGYDPGFHPEDNTVGTSDWLVILYMAGDNDLGRDNVEWGNPLKMDLKELELSMPNDGATVLALADFDGPHNTYLYNISKNLTREIGSQTIPLSDVDLSWVDEVDMSDPETLRKFLVYSMGNYSALNTMFVLWDHGSGWYFNSLSPGSRSSDPDTRGFAQDSNSGGVMYLDEFRDAFIEAGKELGELSMDIVGFDTCSMGMMEVYYQVSPWFDLAIGSEDEQPYYGYNYSFISGMGGSNPLDPVELGKDVIDRFSNEYNTPGGYLYGSICLVDLKKMKDSFIPAMDSMLLPVMERMYQNENLSDHLFHSIVGKTEPITYTEPDLGDLLIKLADSDLQDDITISAGALLIKYDEMVLDEWHKSDGRNPGATGISIYLPKWNPTSPIIHPMYHGYTGFLNFTMDTLWDEMLIEYHHPIQRVLVTLNLSAMDGDLLKDDLVISADNPQVGLPISSGKVYLNGEYSADTDGEGQVLMKNMGPGMYHVEVFNGTHVGQASIRVLNRPPVPVVNPASPIVHEGEHFFLDASMSSDPDDDKMTFVWDLDLSNGENDTDSTLHRVNLVYFESGTHSVKLIVSDGELNSSVIISIQVLNMPPNPRLVIPMDVPEDSYFDIDASGSWDIGPDDDTLMFMYLVDDEPIGGWTNRSSTSYSLSRSGEYEVKVVVRDQDGDENTTSGMLTVRNVIPIANFTGPVELREGQIGTFDASLSTDSSSDIGGLNYTWYTQLGPDPIGYGKQLELVCYTEEDLALQLMVTDD
ncbi:MAG: clostripain-related cysteine peptidase, partial [Candidatus Thermoplasmatota archaeon]|nr:clostripain-related cysteine peptidase [Candidatus Thermoplasmatota archaeon]